MRSLLLCLFLLGWLSGCRTYVHVHDQRESLVLRTVEHPEGEVTYRLYTSSATTPKINRTRTVSEEVATLGVVARTLSSDAARERGLEPWRGVLVEGVTRGSAAAAGGLRGGDVLLSLGGTPLTSGEQLADLVELELEPFETVTAEVLRVAEEGGYELQPRVLELKPEGKMVEEATTDSFDLPTSRLVRRLTGMQIGGVEAELASEAFQRDHPLVVVGYVQVGSPAYFCGVRGGDRIATCDGQPVRSVLDVHRAVLARARSRGLRESGLDEPDLKGALEVAPVEIAPEGPVVLELVGPLGAHRAELGLADDLAEVRSFDVPILLDYRADVVRKRVSFLHFIFQWGFHYQRAYQPSETRRAERSTHLSILPLGMFEFESRPTKKEYTYFWFITFESRR